MLTSKPVLAIGGIILIAAGFGTTAVFLPREQASTRTKPETTQSKPRTTTPEQPVASGRLELNATAKFGDEYAVTGKLPVGDGKYSTTTASKGTVYACSQYAQNFGKDRGGAGTKGPWFSADGKTVDVTKKSRVRGSVKWTPQFTNTLTGAQRTIVTNDLPSHTTGVFPIASSDPAYSYDRNPNRIQAQSLTFNLPANPTYGDPQCVGGEVGIMLTGVTLFNAFDAGGRDAGAWEVQDDCGGHPQVEGLYHYHTLSSCIGDTSVSTVIGYGLDGFPITGPKVSDGNILTTDDLDECHGITSNLTIAGKTSTVYHYVMTQDFPYSISCFRSTATQMQDSLHTKPQPRM